MDGISSRFLKLVFLASCMLSIAGCQNRNSSNVVCWEEPVTPGMYGKNLGTGAGLNTRTVCTPVAARPRRAAPTVASDSRDSSSGGYSSLSMRGDASSSSGGERTSTSGGGAAASSGPGGTSASGGGAAASSGPGGTSAAGSGAAAASGPGGTSAAGSGAAAASGEGGTSAASGGAVAVTGPGGVSAASGH